MPYLNQYLLGEARLYQDLLTQLDELLRGNIYELDEGILKQICYASWQKRNYHWPDQVFQGHWDNLLARKKKEKGWCNALLGQVARYHFVDDPRRIAVKSLKFDEWQSWISNQSGLPVIAYQLSQNLAQHYFEKPHDLYVQIKSILGYRALVSPYHPLVEDYIARKGLHETHLHLNGTTLLEQLWHHALCHPEQIMDRLSKEYNEDPRVKLLYASNPYLSEPKEFYKLLKYARQLRELLLHWLEHGSLNSSNSATHKPIDLMLNFSRLLEDVDTGAVYFPNENLQFSDKPYWTHVSEVHWQVQVQHKLQHSPCVIIDSCYLLYLLCVNCYQRLLVQRSDQFGFDQFQKCADDGVREEIEMDYDARFYQLHGLGPKGKSDLATIEARFAPKKTMLKNIDLLKRMLMGYLTYAQGATSIKHNDDLTVLADEVLCTRRPTFRLVAHFIKTADSGDFHYECLRASLVEQGHLLAELLDNQSNLKQLITGIDAAANEFDAPPEVFACFYRYCRFRGFKHFTYHVGEDFKHLLSGIRVVFDAVTLLDLKNGDRIGHATSIGILPQQWLNNMPEKIYLTKGEWLDNLLFLRQIHINNHHLDMSIHDIEDKIHSLYLDIYKEDVELSLLQKSFEHRGLDPNIVRDYLAKDTLGKIASLRTELTRMEELKLNEKVLRLLKKRWFDEGVLEKSKEIEEVNSSYISAEVLIKVQQYVQQKIKEKHVVIETLPTSNVRISHYTSTKEHHIFRWLAIPQRKIEGDSAMLLTLGSDDPGIFATDMRNEFYHLFSTLRYEFSYSDHDALNCVAALNENGRVYHFENKHYVEDLDNDAMATFEAKHNKHNDNRYD